MTLSLATDVPRTHGDPVPTYLSHVGGRDVASGRYVYTVHARSILTGVFASLTRKRRLEAGSTEDTAGTEVTARATGIRPRDAVFGITPDLGADNALP